MSSRPEHICPPELFYNDKEAAKYHTNSRMVKIQEELSNRALELLNLPPEKECFILDVGCGSGLSGDALEEAGHAWVGVDISESMLEIAAERDTSGDVFHQDMGDGLPFRAGVFDGCISISAIQWLCYSDKKEHFARKRLSTFFTSLYTCLKRGSRAVLQLYPETSSQMELISSCAMKCGFSGGLVVDYPNSTKAKKYFLCLIAGFDDSQKLPQGLGTASSAQEGRIDYSTRQSQQRMSRKRGKQRDGIKARDWVLAKKERYRAQGKEIKRDSKFTARKRPRAF